LSYQRFSFTREELGRYKEQFFFTYIRPFDIHLTQLVSIRNKLHNKVKEIDNIINNNYFTSNIIRIEQYSFELDKWQDIFNEIITKVNQNTLEFYNLGEYLDLDHLDLDQKIIQSVKNS
jgi:hypothetical protein